VRVAENTPAGAVDQATVPVEHLDKGLGARAAGLLQRTGTQEVTSGGQTFFSPLAFHLSFVTESRRSLPAEGVNSL